MKAIIKQLISQTVSKLQQQSDWPAELEADIQLERTKDPKFGDYASNIALMLAKAVKQKPRDIAEKIVASFPVSDNIAKVDIAGPGFINFYLTEKAMQSIVSEVLTQKKEFGCTQIGAGQKILIEFVSANPTGPLHVGHGRGAAFGASLTNLLNAAGYEAHREYYVNDSGRQMDILAVSVWLRYLESCNETLTFPANAYKGDYVKNMALSLFSKHQKKFHQAVETVFANLPADEPQGGDKEIYIDALIARAKELLGQENFKLIHDYSTDLIIDDIRSDLAEFGVSFEHWYSEHSLEEKGLIQHALDALKKQNHVYEKDGALWFKSSEFGDEKDRVLIRSNGAYTYFTPDIAYHIDKYERGYDQVIDILGADHHGYIARMRAAMQSVGKDANQFIVMLVQFANLFRGGVKVQMSTRSGSFVTLRELREEVGNDAARYFYIMRKPEQHMDFDLQLAKSQSNENPVYYIQYAHARICSVLRQLDEKNLQWDQALGLKSLDLLTESHEIDLMRSLARYPELIEAAANAREPHQIAHYLRDLANALHTYYNAHQFIVDEDTLRNARLSLIIATRQVLSNGMEIIGVTAPEKM